MIKYLLGKASTGKFRFAVVECDEEWHEPEHGYVIQRSYGQVGGKTTLSPKIIVDRTKQKRTWKEQYTLQFNSETKKFLDKGYVEVEKHPKEYPLDELQSIFGDVKTNQYGVIKPQLAKQADKVTNPKIFDKEWLISRKLDGVKVKLLGCCERVAFHYRTVDVEFLHSFLLLLDVFLQKDANSFLVNLRVFVI